MKRTDGEKLEIIKNAIRDFHYSIDTKSHKTDDSVRDLISTFENTLDLKFVPGAERLRRQREEDKIKIIKTLELLVNRIKNDEIIYEITPVEETHCPPDGIQNYSSSKDIYINLYL